VGKHYKYSLFKGIMRKGMLFGLAALVGCATPVPAERSPVWVERAVDTGRGYAAVGCLEVNGSLIAAKRDASVEARGRILRLVNRKHNGYGSIYGDEVSDSIVAGDRLCVKVEVAYSGIMP
jgi:hypothetical protein